MYPKPIKCSALIVAAAMLLFISTALFAQPPAGDRLSKSDTPALSETSKTEKPSFAAEPIAEQGTIASKKDESLNAKYFTAEAQEERTDYFASPEQLTSTRFVKQTTPSEWQFGFAPYLFASGISGTIGARGRTIEVDASFGNVFENLDIGLMGTFEAKKGKLIFVSDLIWTKMSAERDTPGGLFSTAKVGVNLFIFDPEVGYRVAESRAGSLDVLGGVRIWSVENNVNLTTGILPGFDVSERKTWAAPVVGVHGILNLSPKFYLSSKFDIGGAGIGADLTTQFYGGFGYRVKPNIALIGGYRYLQVDYDDSEGFIFDTKMSGLLFGAKFSF